MAWDSNRNPDIHHQRAGPRFGSGRLMLNCLWLAAQAGSKPEEIMLPISFKRHRFPPDAIGCRLKEIGRIAPP